MIGCIPREWITTDRTKNYSNVKKQRIRKSFWKKKSFQECIKLVMKIVTTWRQPSWMFELRRQDNEGNQNLEVHHIISPSRNHDSSQNTNKQNCALDRLIVATTCTYYLFFVIKKFIMNVFFFFFFLNSQHKTYKTSTLDFSTYLIILHKCCERRDYRFVSRFLKLFG